MCVIYVVVGHLYLLGADVWVINPPQSAAGEFRQHTEAERAEGHGQEVQALHIL